MRQPRVAFDDVRNDPRLRCILCESLLPPPVPTAAIERMPDPICLKCRALAPDERRVLRDRARVRFWRHNIAR